MEKLKIVYRKINDLTPYDNNPRLNDAAVDAVAKSIEEFGFKVPIVIDKDGVIVAGHTRLKAAKQLQIDEVPCIIADDLSDEELKAFRLADNKVSELAEWDWNKLGLELAKINEIDMLDFGFDELVSGDDFDTDFTLPNNDEPLFKNMTFILSNTQFDVINDALDAIELTEYDKVDNSNTNGNKLYKLVVGCKDLQRK